MKTRVIFVERKASDSVSIERVFRQIAKDLPPDEFDVEFQALPYGNGVLAILKNFLFFRPRRADIYHVTGDVQYISLILPKERTLLTIHDLITLRRRSGIRGYVLKKLFVYLPLRKLKHATTVSEAVKDELVKKTGVEAAAIDVIENPLIDGFVVDGNAPFNTECPLILHIGTAENKNLVNLIRAVQGMKCTLRIVGRLNDKMIKSLELNKVRHENVSGLDENQIVEEYRNADIVSLCSTYEGFGLPIIEAQAMRRAVVTSDLAPMNAVAGGGAALVDPDDVSSIKDALTRLINDSAYRRALIDAGAENVRRFDGRAIAAQYAEIYRRMRLRADPDRKAPART